MSENSTSEQEFVKRLTKIVEANLQNEQFGVSELANKLNCSRTILYRKVKFYSGKSISAFIREFRLQKALEKLQKNEGNVSEIAEAVGFGSVTYFIKCFHDYFGYPPGDVLKKESELPFEKPKEKILTKTRFFKKTIIFPLLFALVAIIVLSVFFIQHSTKRSIEKSIAVLPFVNDTPEIGNIYMDGLREEIIYKLSLIGDIKIVSRTSSDQYRNSDKPIKIIARELKVNYLLEGSSQTINGQTRIRMQLIEAKTDNHLWSKPFEREINDKNIFEIQQEIAGLVSKYLNANITPAEKYLMSKSDTKNKTAYSFYLEGMNYYNIYLKELNYEPLKKAEIALKHSIQYDSIYARAIYRLAWVLFQESKFGDTQVKRDSCIILVNKAIEINPLFSEAYSFKGFLCQSNPKEATKAFNMAIRTGPDKPEGYHQFGNFCCNIGEYSNTVKYSLKAIEVNPDPLIHDWTLINLNVALSSNGFFDVAAKYRNEYMVQHNNRMIYLNMQQSEAIMNKKYAESVKYGLLAYNLDSADLTTLEYLGQNYMFLHDFENALFYYTKYFEHLKTRTNFTDFQNESDFLLYNNRHSNSLGIDIFPLLNTTYLYGKLQDKNKFEIHKKALLANIEKHLEYNTLWSQSKLNYFELACIAAFLNENAKALEYLEYLAKGKVSPVWLLNYFDDHPMLENLKNTPGFQEIRKKIESNYQKEHSKTKQILADNGIINTEI
ncbi:MAG: helix-turn-helix domain-containing protein [Mariniphaga sp.]|nr:helix-turn-helix domain-containing protein [Mariniphaga sp.]